MIKKFLLSVVLFLSLALSANATSYTYEVDFHDFEFEGIPSFDFLFDGYRLTDENVYQANFENLGLGGQDVLSAQLEITQVGNADTCISTERWYIKSFDKYVGDFSRSPGFLLSENWVTDTWQLSDAIITKMCFYDFLPISFLEGTSGMDIAAIDKMKITVETNPVPEPATMVLLGVGLCFSTLFGRKKLVFVKK